MEVLAEQPAVVVVAAPLQVRLGGMGVLAAQAWAEMAGHQAPLRAVQVTHLHQVALALLVLAAAAAHQELAAQVAPEQSGHKPQTARPLALAAVAAAVAA